MAWLKQSLSFFEKSIVIPIWLYEIWWRSVRAVARPCGTRASWSWCLKRMGLTNTYTSNTAIPSAVGIAKVYIQGRAAGNCMIQSFSWSTTSFPFKATMSIALAQANILTFKLIANLPILFRFDVKWISG